MAWIKIKSSLTGKVDLVTETAYNTYFKSTGLYTILEHQPTTEVNKKPIQPKEEIEDGENLQLNNKNEINSSGKDKKKARV